MRIAVIGVGGVGGYFGGRLAQAGCDVLFATTKASAAHLRSHGLRVRSPEGDFEITAPRVYGGEDLPPVDLAIFTVKAIHLRQAAAEAQKLIGPETVLLPLENGVEAPDILGELFGKEKVLGGYCRILSKKTGIGEIEHMGGERDGPQIVFGELRGLRTPRIDHICAELSRASKMTAVVPPDIEASMWSKFISVGSIGAVGAAARVPAGILRTVPATRQLLKDCVEEFVRVGRAKGVALRADAVEQAVIAHDALPVEATISMQRDIMAGLPSELEYQLGTIVRFGAQCKVPTPVCAALYAVLLPSELKAWGKL